MCARLSWPSRELLRARKSIVSYRIVQLYCVGVCNIVEVYPESANAMSGMNVTIHCVADSEESRKWGVAWEFVRNDSHLPTIICYGADVPLVQWNGKYECKSDGNKHSLLIRNVSFNDSGDYVCIEDGGRGPDKDSLELLISRKYILYTVLILRSYQKNFRYEKSTRS